MKTLSTIPVYFMLITVAMAQDSITAKKHEYKIKVLDMNAKVTNGYLAAISDSSIQISNKPLQISNTTNPAWTQVSYNHIDEIRLVKKNHTTNGLLVGAVTGIVIGAIGGFLDGDDPDYCVANPGFLCGLGNIGRMTASEKAIGYGILLGAAGGITGTIIGALAHKTFIIKGNKEKMREMRDRLLFKIP